MRNIKAHIQKLLSKAAASIGLIEYNVNDPAVPLVVKEVIPQLPNPSPPFSVMGFTGQPGKPGSLEAQAAAIYTNIVHCLELVQQSAERPVVRWPRTNNLIVTPRAGRQLNAYYDGHSLKFFYGVNPVSKKIVYMCESMDVVSHELGHAILDSYRTDLWNTASLEIMAFHESFGDMIAILSALWHDEVVNFMLAETNGNLRQSNMVSRLAEEMGAAAYANMNRAETALRNAVNGFVYTPPERLPYIAPIDSLSGEPHSFSRVFTGAFYDLLCYQFEKNLHDHNQHDALVEARKQVSVALFGGILAAPTTHQFYDSVARTMMIADGNCGGKCIEGIRRCFTDRGILKPVQFSPHPVAFKMDGSDSKIFKHEHGSTVRVGGISTIKLIDNMALTQSDNPLYATEIDIPNEHYLEYDRKGKLKLERPVIKEEVLTCAKSFVDFLVATDRVAYTITAEPEKEYSVIDNKLIRNFICCKH